jgi:hypothetical protein
MATKTCKYGRDLAGGFAFAKELIEQFNRESPVGTAVWYWKTLLFGPVLETTVREPAMVVLEGDSNAGVPVVFLAGVAGYVSLFHVTVPLESQRDYVSFVEKT